jgi:hypothetical protein
MLLLSIDVGMRNLAYCIIEYNTEIEIKHWGIINLCNDKKYSCGGKSKKGDPCTKNGKYIKGKKSYCKIHSKDKGLKYPTSEYNKFSIKKHKLKKLKEVALKYEIALDGKKLKKTDVVEIMITDLSNNYFDIVSNIAAKEIGMVTYGQGIKYMFNERFANMNFDYILIENQIGPLALRMKCLQGMIMQHFIENNNNNIFCINSSNKLKDYIGNKKTTYNERKKEGIIITRKLLIDNTLLNNWVEIFNNHKKKDDLADSFLQCVWYINNNIKKL